MVPRGPCLPQGKFLFMPPHLVRAVQDHAAILLWKSDGLHYNGAGLQDGIAHNYSMHVLHHLKKFHAFDKAAAFEAIMCAACWAPQPKHTAGRIGSELAQRVQHVSH